MHVEACTLTHSLTTKRNYPIFIPDFGSSHFLRIETSLTSNTASLWILPCSQASSLSRSPPVCYNSLLCVLLLLFFSAEEPGTETKAGRMKKGKSDMWKKPQCFLVLSRQTWGPKLSFPSADFCLCTSHNLYPHPDTNHRLNPKLPCAKHDNPASPPTSTAKFLPQNKTKTHNYHLCCFPNTIINGGWANLCMCVCVREYIHRKMLIFTYRWPTFLFHLIILNWCVFFYGCQSSVECFFFFGRSSKFNGSPALPLWPLL